MSIALAVSQSKGRRYPEEDSLRRTPFQRDRDRVIHCTAFRRLEYKTQVFINHEGDHYRTRLTHSLEVAQIGRSVARSMELNEDLVEAICLAHDLGHTPFGHAGQDVLDACMKPYGGFEHNLQSLRVVDVLEEKYADFDGLNLTFETREGILKHCDVETAESLGDVGLRFITGGQPSLEAQLANVADELAYNHHDIDDGLRSGLLAIDQLRDVKLFSTAFDHVVRAKGDLPFGRLRYEIIRVMMDAAINDLIESSSERVVAAGVRSVEDVRQAKKPLIGYSDAMHRDMLDLKRFLHKQLYHHPRVTDVMTRYTAVIRALFDKFFMESELMPQRYARRVAEASDPSERARVVCDYIAGMTDRYAEKEYERVS